MTLFVKNMVSNCCKTIVKLELEKLNLRYTSVELGEIHSADSLNINQLAALRTNLGKHSLELLEDKRTIIVEKIKAAVIEMIHYSDELPKINFSAFISKKLKYDYKYLSNLFAEVQHTTIEQFIILHKIERVKELLAYGELSLTKIAEMMQYSSVAALANQFKKVTGQTSQHYKKNRAKGRKPWEDL